MGPTAPLSRWPVYLGLVDSIYSTRASHSTLSRYRHRPVRLARHLYGRADAAPHVRHARGAGDRCLAGRRQHARRIVAWRARRNGVHPRDGWSLPSRSGHRWPVEAVHMPWRLQRRKDSGRSRGCADTSCLSTNRNHEGGFQLRLAVAGFPALPPSLLERPAQRFLSRVAD